MNEERGMMTSMTTERGGSMFDLGRSAGLRFVILSLAVAISLTLALSPASAQGQFRPLEGSNPRVGTHGRMETVDEYRVELVCRNEVLPDVLRALV